MKTKKLISVLLSVVMSLILISPAALASEENASLAPMQDMGSSFDDGLPDNFTTMETLRKLAWRSNTDAPGTYYWHNGTPALCGQVAPWEYAPIKIAVKPNAQYKITMDVTTNQGGSFYVYYSSDWDAVSNKPASGSNNMYTEGNYSDTDKSLVSNATAQTIYTVEAYIKTGEVQTSMYLAVRDGASKVQNFCVDNVSIIEAAPPEDPIDEDGDIGSNFDDGLPKNFTTMETARKLAWRSNTDAPGTYYWHNGTPALCVQVGSWEYAPIKIAVKPNTKYNITMDVSTNQGGSFYVYYCSDWDTAGNKPASGSNNMYIEGNYSDADKSLVSNAAAQTVYNVTAVVKTGEAQRSMYLAVRDGASKAQSFCVDNLSIISEKTPDEPDPELDTIKPGLNILTGTAEPYTFDNGLSSSFTSSATTFEVVNSPVANDQGNKVLKVADTSRWPNFKISFDAISKRRPLTVSFKGYKTLGEGASEDGNLWLHKASANVANIIYDTGKGFKGNTDSWLSFSKYCNNFDKVADTGNTSSIVFNYQTANGSQLLTNGYFDNISVIPAYKITYHYSPEGNNEVNYLDLSSETQFTPGLSTDKERSIIGWSRTKDGAPEETIALENKDIDLYAVYDDSVYINATASVSLLSEVNATATLTATAVQAGRTLDSKNLSYEIVSGNECAELTDNGNGTAQIKSVSEGVVKIKCSYGSDAFTYLYILCKNGDGDDFSAVKIVESKSEVNIDGESVILKGYKFSNTGPSSDNLTWSVDKEEIANIGVDSNGNTVITALKNGTVNVMATSVDGMLSDVTEITFTNQSERIPVYDFRVAFWGCSTLKHGASPENNFPGGYGMAASSIDKDFAHRFLSKLREKYPYCSITYDMFANAHWDNTVISDAPANATLDYYTSSWDYGNVKTLVENVKPNIFISANTENINTGKVHPNCAVDGYRALYDMIYGIVPDTVIANMTCTVGCKTVAHTIMNTLSDEYKSEGKKFAYHHWTDNDVKEYYGWDLTDVTPGYKAHPSDAGMEAIADYFMDIVEPYIMSSFMPTYIVLPKTLTIEGPNAITEKEGKIQLSVSAEPATASTDVEWSVNDENIAVINENGELTAINNTNDENHLIVYAVSKYDNEIVAQKNITVSGQADSYKVTYNKNTEDNVSGMPSDFNFARGNFTLSDIIPERKYYTFLGWSLHPDSKETVTELKNIDKNTTVYAVWEKTVGFEFDGNYDEQRGFTYGFITINGFHSAIENGRLTTISSMANPVTFVSPELDIDTKKYCVFALESEYANDISEIQVKIKYGDETCENKIFDLDSEKDIGYILPLDTDKAKIKGIEIFVNSVPEDIAAMYTLFLDYVRFTDKPYIDFGKQSHYKVIKDGYDAVDLRFNSEKGGVVILADYNDDGTMNKAEFLCKTDGLYNSISSSDKKAKAFVWADCEHMSPLFKPVELEVVNNRANKQ